MGEGREADRVRGSDQEQQPGQQGRPADLAERERDLGGARGLGPAALESGQQVERDRQRFPREQDRERIGAGENHRERSDRERVARGEPLPADGTGARRPAGEGHRHGDGRAQRHDQEQPGEPVGGQPERLLARKRLPEQAADAEPDGAAGERGAADRGEAATAGRAEQVRQPAGPAPSRVRETEQVTRRRSGQEDQSGREHPAHHASSRPSPRRPTARSSALRMPNGLGGEPGSQTSTGTRSEMPPSVMSLSAQEAATDRVGAGGDHDLRVGHPVVGGPQRPGHPGRSRSGDEQDVGMARAGGEEDPEPVNVVHRAEQREDLPFVAAVGIPRRRAGCARCGAAPRFAGAGWPGRRPGSRPFRERPGPPAGPGSARWRAGPSRPLTTRKRRDARRRTSRRGCTGPDRAERDRAVRPG